MARAVHRPCRRASARAARTVTDLTDDAAHAEALALLRVHPAMDQARAYVVARAGEAKEHLDVRPRRPGPAALEAFADVVATRSS